MKQYLRIYNSAEISITKELDAVKVIRDLRHLRTINQNVFDDKLAAFLIQHAEANVIDMTDDRLVPRVRPNEV